MAQDELQLQKKDGNGKIKSGTNKEKESKAKEKPPTKVVIRRLPPTMSEEVFIEQTDPLPENDFFYYVKGEVHVGVPTFSRAYINFKNQEDIFTFRDKFDGYVFLDQRGSEFPALVEFAPYQKIPRQDSQAKEDKCNNLENDPHYIEFVKKLENPEEITLLSAEAYLEQIEQKERELKAGGNTKPITPLVEFIINRRLEKEKFREEKKEERKRKEQERKKQRELERLKKKDGRKERDEKRDKYKVEEKAHFKVLKNTERSEVTGETKILAKEEKKPAEVVGPTVHGKKSQSEKGSRSKEQKFRDKPLREKESQRTKASAEKKNVADVIERKPEEDKVASVRVNQPNDAVTEEKKVEADHQAALTDRKPKEATQEDGKKRGREDREGETEKERRERIRNKDRPAMQIYRPGAKRSGGGKQTEADNVESPSVNSKRDVKTRTFTRSTPKDWLTELRV